MWTPGRGDFWILKITHAPFPKNLSKNRFCTRKGGSLSVRRHFCKKFFRCGRRFRYRSTPSADCSHALVPRRLRSRQPHSSLIGV
jgi:hypothetical protein